MGGRVHHSKQHRPRHRHGAYHKMTKTEIEISRAKLGLNAAKMGRCQQHGCQSQASNLCKYCNREFCDYHARPVIATNLHEIASASKETDPELWKEMDESWQTPGGHADSNYTKERLNYYRDRPYKTTYGDGVLRYSDFKESQAQSNINWPGKDKKYGPKHSKSHQAYGNSAEWKDRPVESKKQQPKHSGTRYIIWILAAVILIILIMLMNLANQKTVITTTTTSLLGTYSNPFPPNNNNTLNWQGPGYYTVPLNIPASGLKGGENQLTSKSQVDGYNQWVYATGADKTTTTPVTSTASTTASTTIYDTTNITKQQSQSSSVWATEFFQNLSADRGTQYSYCPSLSQFAKLRFNTMSANYGISHYGYDQDFSNFYGTIYNTYFAEEVFYPNLGLFGDTPSSYPSYIESKAPIHWQLLMDNNYSYYGYNIQNGPNYEIYGPDGGYAVCPVTEIPGPNINLTQFFAQYGCSVVVVNTTWFVMELASACP